MIRQHAHSNWRKSSYSNQETVCVEVSIEPGAVGVRDTKSRAAGHLTVTPDAWTAFVRAADRAMR